MTDTEWKTATLDDVQAGQLVRLEHGDGSVLIRTAQEWTALNVGSLFIDLLEDGSGSQRRLDVLTRDGGWSVFVPVPPKPELPTADGYYTDKDGDVWRRELGMWTCAAVRSGAAARYVPFTRLEPVPVTATAILKRVEEILRGIDLPNEFSGLAREFGIQK